MVHLSFKVDILLNNIVGGAMGFLFVATCFIGTQTQIKRRLKKKKQQQISTMSKGLLFCQTLDRRASTLHREDGLGNKKAFPPFKAQWVPNVEVIYCGRSSKSLSPRSLTNFPISLVCLTPFFYTRFHIAF